MSAPTALMQRHRNLRLAAHAGEPRGNDPRVVEHQQIARIQQRGQIAHHAVFEPGPGDAQQARGVARLDGALRDAVLRQIEIEFGNEYKLRVRSALRPTITFGDFVARLRLATGSRHQPVERLEIGPRGTIGEIIFSC